MPYVSPFLCGVLSSDHAASSTISFLLQRFLAYMLPCNVRWSASVAHNIKIMIPIRHLKVTNRWRIPCGLDFYVYIILLNRYLADIMRQTTCSRS